MTQTVLERASELIRYSAARKPLLLVPQDKLDAFLEEVAGKELLLNGRWYFDGALVRCAPRMSGDLAVIDMEG